MRLLQLFVVLVVAVPVGAQTLSRADHAYIDSLVGATYKMNEPGGTVLVAINGKPVYRKAFGLASVELKVPNAPESVFRVGSISKQFTAVAMLQLAQAGKLSLEDDIRKYLPWYDTHGRLITIANLLSHTSGIPSYTEKPGFEKMMNTTITKRGLAEYVMGDSLLFEPGTDWSYSNTGYAMANLVIEAVSEMPFEDYLQRNIFQALGMRYSTTGSNDRTIPGAVTGYDRIGEGQYKPSACLDWSWPYGGGQVLSSVDDMLKWDEALYTDKVLEEQWRAKAWTSFILADGRESNYGFGWSVGTWKGLKVIEHGGAINGFLSNAIRIPSKHVYVIALSNNTSAPPRFTDQIALRLAGQPMVLPVALEADSATLNDYVGMFLVERSGGRLTSNSTTEQLYRAITLSNDTLSAQVTGGAKTPLRPIGKDLFTFGESFTFARFVRNPDGAVTAVEISQEPITIGPASVEKKTDVPLPAPKPTVTLDAKTLERYRGKYQLVPGFIIEITTEGDRIFGQATGQPRFELFPESDTLFNLRVVDASIEFVLDEKGEVVSAFLNQRGRRPLTKID